MENEPVRKSKSKIAVIILLIVTITAVCVSLWAILFRDTDMELTPDYAPQEEEQYAEDIPDDSDDKLDSPEGGSSVSLTYSRDVAISLDEKTASLMFANPGKSNQDMVIQVVIQDEVVIQSGILEPGKQVKTLDLLDGMEDKLSSGTYEGDFIVLYYDPETGEKAIVNTEIPISITVSN